MRNMGRKSTVSAYIAALPPAPRKAVKQLRALIRGAVPAVTERISYGIPTFDLGGKYLVYVAGWTTYVSLYPVTSGMERALSAKLKPYRSGKGTLRFPLDKPMPLPLIRRIVASRVAEVASKQAR